MGSLKGEVLGERVYKKNKRTHEDLEMKMNRGSFEIFQQFNIARTGWRAEMKTETKEVKKSLEVYMKFRLEAK